MDERVRQLLDQIPERAPRSKLEPHAEVIRELRRKRRTYQEIAAFFREHLQISVAPSTIHDFVKTRARQVRNRTAGAAELPATSETAQSTLPSQGATITPVTGAPASPDQVRERIRAVRAQPVSTKQGPRLFEYDPEKPLTLINPTNKEK